MARQTNVTRMAAASRDMERARQSGDRKAFNQAFSVFDRVRSNSTPEEYMDLYPELRDDTR
jgi:hypothetical protein